MVVARPFKAIRPVKNLASKIASLPYDVIDSDEARKIAKGNPYSFLHVDKAEIDLDININVHDKRVYEKARDNLNRMIKNGDFIQDKENYFYIYRQIMNKREQVGLVFTASIDDYRNNIIKKHEFTRADKEIDRINHVDYCNANTGPIFLTYRKNIEISKIIRKYIKREAEYDFYSEDSVRQSVWIINEKKDIKDLIKLFKTIDNMYIADGHHRCESAAKVGEMRRLDKPNYTGDEEFNYFLAVAFPDEDLYIMDYNRVVKDLNGLTKDEFINRISEDFNVSKHNGHGGYKPIKKHTFGMYLEKEWFVLEAKNDSFDENNLIESLDVSILQKNVLEKILDIKDIRTSDRIDFIGGIRGIKELERRVNKDMKVAFSMYPTDIHEVMDISDINEVMPPKSTWFEPKLRSGLFIHKL